MQAVDDVLGKYVITTTGLDDTIDHLFLQSELWDIVRKVVHYVSVQNCAKNLEPVKFGEKCLFQVFENDRSADIYEYPQLKGEGWKYSVFFSFDEALDYARKWIDDKNAQIKLNEKFFYKNSGIADFVIIKMVDFYLP